MGEVIKFPNKAKSNLQDTQKIKKFSDTLDLLITNALLQESFQPIEVAGIIAHRLGALLGTIKQKHQLWPICQTLIKEQARLEKPKNSS